MIRSLKVVIDNPQQAYFPGQYVAGKVILTISDHLNVIDISCRLEGSAQVYWMVRDEDGYERGFGSEELYCNETRTFLRPDGTWTVLPPGKYTYAFTAQIPLGVPASFESDVGWVRYQVIADVKKVRFPDMQAKHTISVIDPLDLNTIPNLSTGVTVKGEKTLCRFCCRTGRIIAEVTVDRQGFVPGETIPFRLEIENHSVEDLSHITAALVMKALYRDRSHPRTDHISINKIRHGELKAGEMRTWHGNLHIPAVPPSFLAGCNIIDISYSINIGVVTPSSSSNMSLPVGVTIGSIPLRHVAEHHGLALPSYDDATTSAIASPSSAINNGPPMPPTLPSNMTFAKSALGRAEKHRYAPMYTYYNWGQPETNELVPNASQTEEPPYPTHTRL